MEPWWGIFHLTFLCFLMHIRGLHPAGLRSEARGEGLGCSHSGEQSASAERQPGLRGWIVAEPRSGPWGCQWVPSALSSSALPCLGRSQVPSDVFAAGLVRGSRGHGVVPPGPHLQACLHVAAVRGQGDFDLADALNDPEPTKKPSSDIYPKPRPPYQPQPGNPDNSGNIYPRPKPLPRPQPGSSDNSGGGGGSYPPSHDGHGSTHGGDGYPSYGNLQGNRIAKIVSPVVCGVLVTLVGATASYFQYNRRRNCCRANEPENI
ncbi:glycoprotein Xg-like [Eubalaena glacialis]|uniref:glycoprotein Xg-like n=1 Tax=Eubalaena glacialis TaxID=27606 RepID=UPI002A5A5736|nr:glycoprotein Xg-like [Eubalaena glacialis]XP_061035602.1 glycoprotein Xg-like [Eubalaena glacialis]